MKFTTLIAGAALAALVSGGRPRAAAINVVTTTEDLAALAREVGGDKVKVDAIARGYQDPHFVDPKPSFILKLHSADLLVAVGRELEIGWLPPLMQQSRNAKIQPGADGYLDASLTVKILELPTGQITRAMGDVHPQGNPHYWLDPDNGRRIAQAIQAKLTPWTRPTRRTSRSATPTSTSGSRRPRSAGTPRMAPYKGTKIVTYHRSWPNFADRFGLDVIGYVEPQPGIPPSPSAHARSHQRDEAAEREADPRRAVLRPEDAERPSAVRRARRCWCCRPRSAARRK